jgi:hypothetical protein
VPIDFTGSNFDTISDSTTFELQMINPCHDSILDQLSLEPVVYEVKSETVYLSYDRVGNSISWQYGPKDGYTFCGPLGYSVYNVEVYGNFMGLDPVNRIVSIYTDDF